MEGKEGVLTGLAKSALAKSIILDEYVASNNRPPISIENDTFQSLPADIEQCRQDLIQTTKTLNTLSSGPVQQLVSLLFTFTDLLSLRFIHHYNIPKHVPADQAVPFEDIAKAVSVDPNVLKRMVQHAITNGIFQEPKPGYVGHTVVSRMLHDDPEAMDGVGFLMHDMHPASTKVIEAMEKYPNLNEPSETGYNVAFDTKDTFYVDLAKNPERARRFGGGMRWMTRGPLYDVNRLAQGYGWKDLDKPGATVVDLGGGHGGVSRALAKATSNIHFVVQDLPGTAEEGRNLLPAELKERVEFVAHDFLTPQPLKGAEVYLFRFILHNWPDQYVKRILSNLIPAMKDGSRVLIYEFLLQETVDTTLLEKHGRNLDMIALANFNASERTFSDWARIFSEVDSRFELLPAHRQEGTAIALMEAKFSAS